MTPKTFLEHFSHLAGTPGAVKRLRELILQLAVMGKLVPQDPNDEPASVLLKKIAVEKARLMKAGKIRKSEPLPPIKPEEVPIELPEGWEWCLLGNISHNVHYGYTASSDPSLDNVRLLRITDIQDNRVNWQLVPGCTIDNNSIDKYRLKDNDILIARTGGTIGKTYLIKNLPVCSVFASYLIRVVPSMELDVAFLKRFTESFLYWKQVLSMASGTGQPNVNATSLKELFVPLPPIAEQHRIVARVDQLMVLCDQLEKQEAQAKETHQALTQSTLHALTTADGPHAFQTAWHRIRDHFDPLFITPETVTQLRQTILQLAVMGKLVPQDPNDEPASVLLKKIAAEKARLVKEGKIRKSVPLPPVKPEEVPFELPEGWEFVRIGNLINISSGNFLPSHQMAKEGLIPVYGGNGVTGYHDKPNISEETLVIGRVGFYCGSIHLTPKKAWVTDNAFITKFQNQYLDIQFLYWLLKSTDLKKDDNATAQPVISGKKVYPIIVALPPFTEQRRIANRVEQLIALCDRLAEQLKEAQADSVQLIKSAIHHLSAA